MKFICFISSNLYCHFAISIKLFWLPITVKNHNAIYTQRTNDEIHVHFICELSKLKLMKKIEDIMFSFQFEKHNEEQK